MSIKNRLERVNYQLLKDSISNPQKSWTDQDLLDNIRSIYDAAIDPEIETEIASATLPNQVFNIPVYWFDENTRIVSVTDKMGVADDLIDEEVTDVGDTTKYLEVGGEYLISGGDFFKLSIDITDSNDLYADLETSFGEYVIANYPNSVYSSTNIVIKIDEESLAGQEFVMPLPTTHDKSSIQLNWTGPDIDTTSNYIAVDYSGESFGSLFTVESAANGSVAYKNDSVSSGNDSKLTLTFDIDGSTFTKEYNISFI